MNTTLIVTHVGEAISPFRPDLNDRIADKVNVADFVIFYDAPGSCPPCPVEEFAKLGINAMQVYGGPIPDSVESWGENSEDYTFEICGSGADSLILGILFALKAQFPLAKVRIDISCVDSLTSTISIAAHSVDTDTDSEEVEVGGGFFDVVCGIYLRAGANVFTSASNEVPDFVTDFLADALEECDGNCDCDGSCGCDCHCHDGEGEGPSEV